MSVNECRSSFNNNTNFRGDANILLTDMYDDTIGEHLRNLKIHVSNPPSPCSSKCSLSPSLLDDFEISAINQITSDELPIFSIKSISPTGCSLSPINDNADDDNYFDDAVESTRFNMAISPISSCYDDNSTNSDDTMTLDEMHEKIGTTPKNSKPNKNLNLETIFEGVFLETPPKAKKSRTKITSRF